MHWDEEFEGMRPQLRAEADAFLASLDTMPDDPELSQADWLVAQRNAHFRDAPISDHAVDRTIEGPAGPLRLRTFVPETVDGVMLHIHGGAFVTGAPETTDILNEILSNELNLAIASVDYRLAPEDPYPAGPDDCEAAAVWLLERAETEYGSGRLLIGGESAGAHLSACTLLRIRDRHDAVDRFVGANLVFGIYDLGRTPSQRVNQRPDLLSVAALEHTVACFTPGRSPEERRDPDVSPLYADLRGMPPAQFVVGADDHLVDDTLFMAARWELAGNECDLVVYPETPHGGIGMPTVGAHWFPRLIEFLRGCIEG